MKQFASMNWSVIFTLKTSFVFLLLYFFIGPKSDHCLVLSVTADDSFSSLVETLLMWPWRLKMLSSYNLPLLPFWICLICYMDLLKLSHVFLRQSIQCLECVVLLAMFIQFLSRYMPLSFWSLAFRQDWAQGEPEKFICELARWWWHNNNKYEDDEESDGYK